MTFLGKILRFMQRNKLSILVVFLLGLLILTQIRTLKNNGELFGFTVLHKSVQKKGVGTLNESEESLICQKLDAKTVGEIIDLKVTSGTISSDIEKPHFYSNCFYRIASGDPSSGKVVVSVSVQGFSNKTEASSAYTQQKNRTTQKTTDLDFKGGQVFYVPSLNRATFQFDKYVVNIFVKSGSSAQAQSSAVKIADKIKGLL